MNRPYRVLPDRRVLVDHGPITMSVLARRGGAPCPEAAGLGAEEALRQLERLIPHLPTARRRIGAVSARDLQGAPESLRRMAASVALLDDGTFTPMAAVAGTFSDLVMEHVLAHTDADAVAVNNGGDIALCSRGTDPARSVGVVGSLSLHRVTHRLHICENRGVRGIATSGFGGRSLTKGIAEAVTVLATSASRADAAATAIANATFVGEAGAVLCPAEALDSQTDLRGDLVVSAVPALAPAVVRQALRQGVARAGALREKGMILGAVLFVGGVMAHFPDDGTLFTVQPVSR